MVETLCRKLFLADLAGASTTMSAIRDSSAGKLALLFWLLPHIVLARGLEGITRYVVARSCTGYRVKTYGFDSKSVSPFLKYRLPVSNDCRTHWKNYRI